MKFLAIFFNAAFWPFLITAICHAQDLSLGTAEKGLSTDATAIVNAIMSASAVQSAEIKSINEKLDKQSAQIDEIKVLVESLAKRPVVEPIPDPEPNRVETRAITRTITRAVVSEPVIESSGCYVNQSGAMVCPTQSHSVGHSQTFQTFPILRRFFR